MPLTLDLATLTVGDLEALDAFVDGGEEPGGSGAARDRVIALLERIAVDGRAAAGALSAAQLAAVARQIRREVADRCAARLPGTLARLAGYLWAGAGPPPEELIAVTLCRLYGCRPSELRAERVADVLAHLAVLAAEGMMRDPQGCGCCMEAK